MHDNENNHSYIRKGDKIYVDRGRLSNGECIVEETSPAGIGIELEVMSQHYLLYVSSHSLFSKYFMT